MNQEQQFAALLAQVIPVVVLAIVVEARHHHTLRIKEGSSSDSQSAGNDFVLYAQTAMLTIMTFLEVCALLTARGMNAPWWIAQFAGFPGVVIVGLLMMVMAEIYIESLVDAYGSQLKNQVLLKKVSRGVLGAAVLFGVVGAVVVGATS